MEKDAVGDGGGGTDRPAHSTDNHLVYRSRTGESDSMAVESAKKIRSFVAFLLRMNVFS